VNSIKWFVLLLNLEYLEIPDSGAKQTILYCSHFSRMDRC